jgi:hypothetical protein
MVLIASWALCLLWHWALIPVAERGPDALAALRAAAENRTTQWLSVVEDRRSGAGRAASVCRLASIDGNAASDPFSFVKGCFVRAGTRVPFARAASAR